MALPRQERALPGEGVPRPPAPGCARMLAAQSPPRGAPCAPSALPSWPSLCLRLGRSRGKGQ